MEAMSLSRMTMPVLLSAFYLKSCLSLNVFRNFSKNALLYSKKVIFDNCLKMTVQASGRTDTLDMEKNLAISLSDWRLADIKCAGLSI